MRGEEEKENKHYDNNRLHDNNELVVDLFGLDTGLTCDT